MNVGDTYFFQDRPVTIMKIKDGMALVRVGNSSKKLDFWVSVKELT